MIRPAVLARVLSLFASMLAVLGLFAEPSAASEPDNNVLSLPLDLQKYTPGSPEWKFTPWSTSPACAGRGGDLSAWVTSVVNETPSLLAAFQPRRFGADVPAEDRVRSDAIVEGYRRLAAEVVPAVPAGFCVNEVATWSDSAAPGSPFGIAWAREPAQRSMYSCAAEPNPGTDAPDVAGADRLMCEGFAVRCDRAQSLNRQRCATWNAVAAEYVAQVDRLRHDAISAHPAVVKGAAVENSPGWAWWGWVAAALGPLILMIGGFVVLRHRARPQSMGPRP